MALIPRVDCTDRQGFCAHVAAETPCVIAGGAADWVATRTWSVPYLTSRVGDVRVRYKHSSSHAHPDFRAATKREWFATGECTLGELLAFVTTDPARATRLFTGDEQWLVRVRDGVTAVHEPLRALLDDAPVPDLVPVDRLYTVWAWFSGAGVRTWLHYDNNGCHNLNAQLTGAKDCTLFPPSELSKLRLFPVGGDNPALNCSEIDLDRETPAATAFTARLDAGDLLFIPAWWLHAFVHVGELNCNVNYWWKPEVATSNPVADREARITASRSSGV